MQLSALSDDEVLSALHAVCLDGHRLLARLLVFLGEVEERRIHLKAASPSMFDFCVRRLGMSEGEAVRRISAARLVRTFPDLLPWIERGDLHLSTLVLLRPHLTDENHVELARASSRKTKLDVERVLAARFPRPDVPSRIQKLPEPREPAASSVGLAFDGETYAPPRERVRPAKIEPLSVTRYKVEFTASTEVYDKLARARELMSHSHPDGEITVIFERALDLLIANLEKQKRGKAEHALETPRPAKSGDVTRAARRAVFARDGEQCAFVDKDGNRCPSRGFLEIDHVLSRARGGSGDSDNLRIYCRGHNGLHAEEVFGREHIAQQIHRRQERSKSRQKQPSVEGAASPAPSPLPFEEALRGLIHLGFRDGDARCAVEHVRSASARPDGVTAELVIREALAVLT